MKKKELITYEDPKSPISEIFRTLRTNIQFMTANKGLKTLLVTSSVPGEGKSWISANLILAFAQEGKKVLIVDSDMRKGRVHDIFETERKPGLSNFLSEIIDAEDKDNIFNYIKETKVQNLFVMPTGDVPPNPSELLVSDRTSLLIEKLKNIFDIVIFDGTPSLIVTDALILARQVDATLIVTAHKTTKMGDIEKIKKSIENVGGKIAGIVINKIPISAKKYEHSYYYGNSRKQEENRKPEKSERLVMQEIKEEHKQEKTIFKEEEKTIKEEKMENNWIPKEENKIENEIENRKEMTEIEEEIQREIGEFIENRAEEKKEDNE